MPAVRRNWLVKTYWRGHKWLYRISGGRLGRSTLGMPTLMLYTTGRKSGQERSNMLMYVRSGDDYVVVGSNAGELTHPAWWLNLQANPTTRINVDGQTMAVTAREAQGEERQRLWKAVVEADRSYAEYEQRTARRIPVVVLEVGEG
jgi:deazaflavin-dependent oxidoreductase (nitroreductase family)